MRIASEMSCAKPVSFQGDITRLERDEMRMRDELHDRLERMVFDVEDHMQVNEQPPQESAATIEMDEL